MQVVRHRSFDDQALVRSWSDALSRRDHDVFMTLGWQRAWWAAYGRGELVLLEAHDDEEVRTLLPLFLDGGMLFLVGSGGSDRLDVVGDRSSRTMAALLEAALDATPGVLGIRLYHLPDDSGSTSAIHEAAQQVGLAVVDEGSIVNPVLHLPSDGQAAVKKKSLVRHERGLQRDGALRVHDIRDAETASEWFERFFEQHIRRWESVGEESPFARDQRERRFYDEVAREGAAEGWLRFLVLEWEGQPAAFHFGTSYGGTYLYYKPSFEVALADHSPGEVMLRRLILAALDEDAEWLDLGIGDEPYKRRFTSLVREVRTIGLYPPNVVGRSV